MMATVLMVGNGVGMRVTMTATSAAATSSATGRELNLPQGLRLGQLLLLLLLLLKKLLLVLQNDRVLEKVQRRRLMRRRWHRLVRTGLDDVSLSPGPHLSLLQRTLAVGTLHHQRLLTSAATAARGHSSSPRSTPSASTSAYATTALHRAPNRGHCVQRRFRDGKSRRGRQEAVLVRVRIMVTTSRSVLVDLNGRSVQLGNARNGPGSLGRWFVPDAPFNLAVVV
uniref:(northern house mosquito) hypothetical protein n=1 Tax=Culex pipiens TaxID=7175 RepID=A0A8D8NCV4_CULPI